MRLGWGVGTARCRFRIPVAGVTCSVLDDAGEVAEVTSEPYRPPLFGYLPGMAPVPSDAARVTTLATRKGERLPRSVGWRGAGPRLVRFRGSGVCFALAPHPNSAGRARQSAHATALPSGRSGKRIDRGPRYHRKDYCQDLPDVKSPPIGARPGRRSSAKRSSASGGVCRAPSSRPADPVSPSVVPAGARKRSGDQTGARVLGRDGP